jgi:4-amino-4-deoxy-L-arabinose transferase-like glycosyltransferase
VGATQQYYPVLFSVFWVEQKLWGEAPLGYHLVNILVHVSCALLLVKVLRRLDVQGPWLAAAIFALHPVQVESVAWIAELKNTLSALCYLGAAAAYLGFDSNRKRSLYLLSLGLFLLGLACKTVIATLPAALLLLLWWKRSRLFWMRDIAPCIPFFVTGISAGLFTAWMERRLSELKAQNSISR